MTQHVLGISAYYHDSAAAIVRGGEVVAAAQEERFTRRKHDPRFPRHAINYCLEDAAIEAEELAAVVFYDNPVLTFDRVFQNALVGAPDTEDQWLSAARSLLGVKAFVHRDLEQTLGCDRPLLCTDHHLSHAASAFYPSPFEDAAILTVDGVGEWATTSLGVGRGEAIELLREIRYPHSLGLLYSAFTYYCGFRVNSGEYKLMGLAPYGEPEYADRIREKLIDLRQDGSFRLDTRFFGFLAGDVMTSEAFHETFGGPPRAPESRIERRHMNLAASVQRVLEEALLALAREAKRLAGSRNLVLAGGVALNAVANGRLLRSGEFDGLWVQPAAGDAGGALGAALLGSHVHLACPRPTRTEGEDGQRASLLGPRFSDPEVAAFLEASDIPHEHIAEPAERARWIARELAGGKAVGHFSGRMEFGPRALGNRSILADSRPPEMQSRLNLKIKYRESFRPFAPAVLRNRASDYFDLDVDSPYMVIVAPVAGAIRKPDPRKAPVATDDDLTVAISRPRSEISAVTHVDYSARVQTVGVRESRELYAILREFEALTGCAVLANTSFNVRGEPIVCTPEDAYRCFMLTDLDVLVLEGYVLRKEDQPAMPDADDWRKKHALD